MELGKKIKQLRYRCGLTQEQLAERLGISPQSVSKWETAVTMPDISLLPALAEELGVSIDELFDLSPEQKLHRIENRLATEEELPADVFREYEEFLKNRLPENKEDWEAQRLLARLYHHRMEADSRRVKKYARAAILAKPEEKDCQWLLDKAEGQHTWDWNVANHASTIDFYKEVIEKDKGTPATPLPYYYLIDNLLADHRTAEARDYLEKVAALPAFRPFLLPVYRAHIALAEYDEKTADGIMEMALEEDGENGGLLFEAAQYYARKGEYRKAIGFYERSFELEPKPRYTDALQGIAVICEILGDIPAALNAYDRMLDCIKNEWSFGEEDAAVSEVRREQSRLLQK